MQPFPFEPHRAVDLRRIGVTAGQGMAGNLRVHRVHDDLDLVADLPPRPVEGDLLLNLPSSDRGARS